MFLPSRRVALGAALVSSLVLSACGGGTSGRYDGSVLSGTVLMGSGRPVNGSGVANVCIYGIVNGQGNPLNTTVTPALNTGTLLTNGCLSSDANGKFSVDLTSFYGPVLIQITGGSYVNASTGAAASLTNLTSTNASLQAVANIGGGGTVNVVVTPLTTVATVIAGAMPNGLTPSNYASASTRVASEFQLGGLALNTQPQLGDAYDMALSGVQQYLAAAPGSTDDANANNLLTWSLTASNVQGDYTSAYNTINHTTATFTFY